MYKLVHLQVRDLDVPLVQQLLQAIQPQVIKAFDMLSFWLEAVSCCLRANTAAAAQI
jgi:hypothetical protein